MEPAGSTSIGKVQSAAVAPGATSAVPTSTAAVVWAGLAALAVAMGIGRFSFTPLLPLMRQDAGVGLVEGSWLAAANYVGYFAGALACIAWSPKPRHVMQWGLASIAVFTAAMGLTHQLWLWLALRFLAGAASACVLVGVSAWVMPILARRRQATWFGRLFAGVGVGIVVAGLVGLVAGLWAWTSQVTWLALGAIAAVCAVVLWRRVTDDDEPATSAVRSKAEPLGGQAWLAAVCYGCFGYGYIIPATFLPAQARELVADPAVFSWVWPVFGAMAALSTELAAWLAPTLSPRRLWIYAQWILAVGVVAAVFATNLYVLLIAAVCVGGTFMVITMAGFQEARRLGGAHASRLIALYTAAFALGQIAGPLTVGAAGGGVLLPSLFAALVLAASNLALGHGTD